MAPKDPQKAHNFERGLSRYVERRLARVHAGKDDDKKHGARLATPARPGVPERTLEQLPGRQQACATQQSAARTPLGVRRWALHSSRRRTLGLPPPPPAPLKLLLRHSRDRYQGGSWGGTRESSSSCGAPAPAAPAGRRRWPTPALEPTPAAASGLQRALSSMRVSGAAERRPETTAFPTTPTPSMPYPL